MGMGATEQCIEQEHAACAETWCDCGCHHALIDAHYAGEHVMGTVTGCHVCEEYGWHYHESEAPPGLAGVLALLTWTCGLGRACHPVADTT
jgi:hypothetical protein